MQCGSQIISLLSFLHSLERFVLNYKIRKQGELNIPPEVIDAAVKDIMDELLDGIVKNFPENPTIPPGDRSGAESPLSTL